MIKEFTENDLEISAKMFYEVFRSPPFNFQWLTIKMAQEYFFELYKSPNFQGFKYTFNEKIIGYCLGERTNTLLSKQYNIKEIFVETNIQKNGFGKLFVKEISEYLKNNDVTSISLYTSRSIPAYNFYCSLNFKEINDTAHFIKLI